jgi:type IV secretion system protein VirD4
MGGLSRLFYSLSLFVHWLTGSLTPKPGLHTARFARPTELSRLAKTNPESPSLILGTGHFGQLLRVSPTPARSELGNLLVVAPIRGGKGLLATAQLLTWPHSVVVNDIKGELYEQTAGYRATLGPVFVLDPTGVGHRFDPLSGRTSEDQLLSSAHHLLFQTHEGEGRIFTERAIVMLTQLFLAARLEGQVPLPYVRRMVRSGLVAAASRLDALDPTLAVQFLDVSFAEANFSDRFLLSSWGTLSTRMRLLLTETVVRCLTASDFSPEALLRSGRPVTVYLRWPERDLGALAPLVRLLWGSILDELITTYDRAKGQGCRPVLMLIDEAGRTAIPSLSEYATTVVGRGITLWVAIQALSQLEDVYGRARADTLRNNMETQLYYRPADLETAQYLERRLGRKSEYAHSRTLREGEEAASGLLEQPVPLLTAQEIMQLADTQVVGFHRNLPPFLLRRMDWRNFTDLVSRRRLPLPGVPALPPLPDPPAQGRGESPLVFVDPDPQVN